mgnify:CR=1 FL=1|jgi:hypothetical protein|nr:MAG TPA_asm: tail protein [Caudoviricetes sp.]
MIHLFLSKKNTTYQQMIERNGDVVLKNCKSAKATFERNSIWYVTIEFPKSELLGMKISEESVFKVDLNFEKGQLFRIVDFKENGISNTYVCYAAHIFFDSQKEIFVFDDRTVNSTWDGAIKTANDIIEKSKSKYPYHVYGDRWYEDYKNIKPEDGREVHIHNAYRPDLCVDVTQSSEDSVPLQMYQTNRTSAQTFILKKYPNEINGISDIWSFMSVCSCRWVCAQDYADHNFSKIETYWLRNDPSNTNMYWEDYWGLVYSQKSNGYKIVRPTDKNYNWWAGDGGLAQGNTVQLFAHGIDNLSSSICWQFEDRASTQTAYWVRYNLIQCLFGSEDNSMMNRWPECEEHRYVAMFDNYDCYFGKPDSYKPKLKPKEFYVGYKEIVDYTKKVSMENVVTGIIPKAYNGRILPNNEIVKSSKWDENEIHRIKVKEYSDVKLMADDSSATKTFGIFKNEANLQAYLRYIAGKDLKNELQDADTETTIKFEKLFGSNIPNANQLKLNDIIYADTKNSGEREKFYLNKMTYDLIKEMPDELTLILETEV